MTGQIERKHPIFVKRSSLLCQLYHILLVSEDQIRSIPLTLRLFPARPPRSGRHSVHQQKSALDHNLLWQRTLTIPDLQYPASPREAQ